MRFPPSPFGSSSFPRKRGAPVENRFLGPFLDFARYERARGLLLLGLLLAGCGQSLTMSDQKKYHEWERASLFRNDRVLQEPPAGTVARDAPPPDPLAQRPPMSLALVERGRERFGIFCTPCHGRLGDGNGMIVQRGFPHPPSYYEPRLMNAPDQHFYDVITHGYGAMFSYADRVPVPDRWAIVAYIRALQRSQSATLADVPPEERARLEAEPAK